jgi:hypothetical protein
MSEVVPGEQGSWEAVLPPYGLNTQRKGILVKLWAKWNDEF